MSAFTVFAIFRAAACFVSLFTALVSHVTTAAAEMPLALAGLPPSERPIIERMSLTTNPANVTRSLTWLEERIGVDQMRSLAGRTMLEEQWAYVPTRRLWIEIGSNEIASGDDSQVELDVDYLMALLDVFGQVRVYHFHPAAYFDRPRRAGELPAGTSGAAALPSERLGSIGFALPSPADVVASLGVAIKLAQEKPKASVTFHVVSPYGVASYGATDSGRNRLVSENGNPLENPGLTILVTSSLRRGEVNLAKTVENLPGATINEVINVLADQMTTPDYEVQFEPVTGRGEG